MWVYRGGVQTICIREVDEDATEKTAFELDLRN